MTTDPARTGSEGRSVAAEQAVLASDDDREQAARRLRTAVEGGRLPLELLASRLTLWSMWGGGRVDLSQARFSSQDTEIRAVALWGGTRITVPDDIDVEVKGFGLFGVLGKGAARRTGRPGAPRVVIKGLALFGAVVTRTSTTGTER
ncbi:LiaF domain-containing protein [Streptomyces sp. NPDC058319]|uniref:LiaF domain-containing protein n=1 Tax=unclassified Streptomyces TaxID=2593676 RepID=UPI0036EFC673